LRLRTAPRLRSRGEFLWRRPGLPSAPPSRPRAKHDLCDHMKLDKPIKILLASPAKTTARTWSQLALAHNTLIGISDTLCLIFKRPAGRTPHRQLDVLKIRDSEASASCGCPRFSRGVGAARRTICSEHGSCFMRFVMTAIEFTGHAPRRGQKKAPTFPLSRPKASCKKRARLFEPQSLVAPSPGWR
jgi:hypothetical protein